MFYGGIFIRYGLLGFVDFVFFDWIGVMLVGEVKYEGYILVVDYYDRYLLEDFRDGGFCFVWE